MALSSPDWVLRNPMCKVLFQGWESTTRNLQEHGWKISIQECPRSWSFNATFEMILHHPELKLSGYATCREDPYKFRDKYCLDRNFNNEMPEFIINKMTSKLILTELCHVSLNGFTEWNDCNPRYEKAERIDIYDLPIFSSLEKPSQEIIIEPQDVMQLMEQIKKLQAPTQAEIRKRRARETTRLEASIMTFAA